MKAPSMNHLGNGRTCRNWQMQEGNLTDHEYRTTGQIVPERSEWIVGILNACDGLEVKEVQKLVRNKSWFYKLFNWR